MESKNARGQCAPYSSHHQGSRLDFRTDLQQAATWLSWGTVTNTTRELLQRGIVREDGARSTKAGRKPVQLALNRMEHCLGGMEIAPDIIRGLMMNLAGETLWYEENKTARGSATPEQVLRNVSNMIQRSLTSPMVMGRNCLGIGIALPGALDVAGGILRRAPRMPAWHDVPVLAILQPKSACAIRLEHNPNCLLLAEPLVRRGRATPKTRCAFIWERAWGWAF